MSFTVSGVDGVLHLIAFLLFLVAAVAAWVQGGAGRLWPSCVAAGLCLWVLATLVH